MNYEKSCGAVIYTVANEKRLYLVEIMQKGHTSFCKGHVEENESEHQTAAREIREETGLEVKFVEGFRQTVEYSPDTDCLKTVVFFLADADSTNVTIQEEEVREIEWLPYEEALTKLTFDSLREVTGGELFKRRLRQVRGVSAPAVCCRRACQSKTAGGRPQHAVDRA